MQEIEHSVSGFLFDYSIYAINLSMDIKEDSPIDGEIGKYFGSQISEGVYGRVASQRVTAMQHFSNKPPPNRT